MEEDRHAFEETLLCERPDPRRFRLGRREPFPAHAEFDALGNTVAQWTAPVADTDPGGVRCTVCGGAVYVAGLPTAPGQVVACDFLGRCQSAPADANLARLDALAARLATCPDADNNRLAPVVAALFAAVAADPAASAVIGAHGLKDRFPGL